MQISLDPSMVEIHAFRRKPNVSEQNQCIVPDLLLLPPPPSTLVAAGSSKNASSKETPVDVPSVQPVIAPKHPLTALATTGTILAVNLDLVASNFHLECSLFKAMTFTNEKKSKTKNALSEILYQLANTGNINEAIRQYFVTEETTEFVLLRISDDDETKTLYQELITGLMNNEQVEEFTLSDINNRLTEDDSKREKLKKLFKLSQFESGPTTIHDAIITKLALKDL